MTPPEDQKDQERTLDELSPLEGLCLLASRDGGRVDLTRERSDRAAAKIQAALDAGAIDAEGWLTEKGKRLAEGEMTGA